MCFLLPSQGTAVAILGPTLLDLACHTHTKLQRMSYVFTSRSVGYLTGSIVGGWLFDKYNGHLVLSLSCTWATLMMLVLPYVRNLYGLVTVVTLLGVACGSLDTGTCVKRLQLIKFIDKWLLFFAEPAGPAGKFSRH